MQKEHLSHINPNYLHGCYPLDLSDYFGESTLFANLQKIPDTRPTVTQPTCFT